MTGFAKSGSSGAIGKVSRGEASPDFAALNPGYDALGYFPARQLYARLNPAAWASSSVQNQRSGFVVAG
jgi:hypothetical protein